MIPSKLLTDKQRIILVVVSVVLMGIGLFINLMRQLERGSSPATSRAAVTSTRSGSSSITQGSASSDASEIEIPHGIVRVNGRDIPVELALDEVTQERGLSYRDSLPADTGMLFIFGESKNQLFWMHEMHFPLDMVFINGTNVVHVSSDVPPPKSGEFPAIRSSEKPADKVLELNAGKAAAWGIAEGTALQIEE